MITSRKKKRIFLNSESADLKPRVLSKRKVNDKKKINSFQFQKSYDMLTVEIACFIDQRALIKEEISEIKVFASSEKLTNLRGRRDFLKEAKRPKLSETNISERRMR